MTLFSHKTLLGISLCHFISDMPFYLLPSALPLIIHTFHLSYGIAGASVTTMIISMVVFQTIVGYCGRKMEKASLLFIGLFIIGIALLLTAFSRDVIQYIILSFFIGLGMAFYHPVGYSIISESFASTERGKAFGINEAMGIAAGPVCFASSSLLLTLFSWRVLFFIWAIITIVISWASLILFRQAKKRTVIPEVHEDGKTISVSNIFTKLSSLLAILVLAEIYLTSLIVFTSTFLTIKEVPIEYANAAVAVMMTMSVLGTFIVGSISDRYGERKTLFGVMVMIFTLSLAIFSFQSTSNVIYLILLICLLGLPILGVTPPIFSLISSRISLKDQTIVFGILLSIAWGIGGLFPYLEGSIADIYGIQIIFGIAAFAAFLSLIIIIMKIKN